MEFDSLFPKSGKQGVVGLLRYTDENQSEKKVVFKIPKYINYLTEHEYKVMKRLEQLDFCPHFCHAFALEEKQIDSAYRECLNPFEITNKYPIRQHILTMEYIDNAPKLYSLIKRQSIPEQVIYAIVKQVLLAIALAQQLHFSHYDLHSQNILMKGCDPDDVFLYILDQETQFCIPTYGYFPVIIDYGFSYIEYEEPGSLLSALAHTDIGFMSDRFDWVADPKLFLVTLSDELLEHKKSKKSLKFRKITTNIFKPLKIDWTTGWDIEIKKNASDLITDYLQTESPFFTEYDSFFIDLVQALITLPLKPKSSANMQLAYAIFTLQYSHIENEISSSFYNLYILKGIVDSARKLKDKYYCSETREEAIRTFRHDVYNQLNEISQFCNPKGIHYEKMLCALYALAEGVEGYLYKVMEYRMKQKRKQYEKMKVSNVAQIYIAIEANLPDRYPFNSHTQVHVFDSLNRRQTVMTLSNEEIDELNDIHPLSRGPVLYEKYHALAEKSN